MPLVDENGLPYRAAPPCDHGITFDDVAFRAATQWSSISATEVRRRWPRLDGTCPKGCGFRGIAYASYLHYIAGDW